MTGYPCAVVDCGVCIATPSSDLCEEHEKTAARGWFFWTQFGRKNYKAVRAWGPFRTKATAQAARTIVTRSGFHKLHCSIERHYDVYEPGDFYSLHAIRKAFKPKPQYCYGSTDGRKHDKGRIKCGCGKLIPTAAMVRARGKRMQKLQAQVKRLQKQIRRMA